MLAGDRRALARLITLVENRSPLVPEIMRRIHDRTGRGYTVGITGPPGAGKSTLVDGLTRLLRRSGATVAVVAVDPTSPFSGGAVLGDRIRMQGHALDPGVFIRSMATRGSLGGLARATAEVQKLLDAAGAEWILIETVGVGQTELEVGRIADTTVVVLVPESGDGVQTMKAGLLEVADVFAVNKADRDGAQALVAELRFMVHLRRRAGEEPEWEPPVVATTATSGAGVEELLRAVQAHRGALEASGELARRRQARRGRELRELMVTELRREVERALADGGPLAPLLDAVESGRLDAYTAIARILERWRAVAARESVSF